MHIPAGPAERSRPGMSTDRITAAALQIVDTEGSQALTMRRLGQALDRKVMTLYRYIPSKDALLDGVVARVLTDLAINPAAADWRQELRGLATSFRGLALAHPNAVPLLVTRPLTSLLGQRPPATLRPLENFLELLIRAGFSPAGARHAYRLFFGFLHGHILDELQEIIDNPDEADDLLRPPTSSSRINLVERWFAELTNRKLRRSAHRSVTDWKPAPAAAAAVAAAAVVFGVSNGSVHDQLSQAQASRSPRCSPRGTPP